MLRQASAAKGMRISELANAAGVHIETVRYYQGIGLLSRTPRQHGRIRRYDADDLKRVRFIKRAQALGFSLEEIALLLGLSNGEHCAETQALAEKKLAMVEGKISDLAAIRKALKGLITECSKGSRRSGCPIIGALAADR
jgi:MerR family transcriptional regulator, mercuric resistance operon regulatory protein